MRLTRRGQAMVLVITAAIAMAAAFGARGLNAVAAPGVVALVAAGVQVWRLDAPSFEREVPTHGARGTSVPIRLHFEVDRPFSARLHDLVDEGLDASGNDRTLALTSGTIEYDVTLVDRGERTIGPTYIEARDVLGLVRKTIRYPGRDEILVRPRVHPLGGPRRADLIRLYGGHSDDRQEFDHLRQYERGDPLRDIHWKSSAKQPDDQLIVKEFAAEEGTRSVEIAAGAAPGQADAMADAAASIAVDLLETGVAVGLSTPSGHLEPDVGLDHRNRLLDHLAVARSGSPKGTGETDVRIRSAGGDVRIELSDGGFSFSELAGAPAKPQHTAEQWVATS